jgi:murein DD-endopeptidase MepM/ murein hydrolase activator NlpD
LRDDDDIVPIIVIGGIIMLATRKGPPPPASLPWGDGWHWPIPDVSIDGIVYPATISQEFHAPAHYGVDLMYRRRSIGDRPDYPPGKGGTTQFFAPDGVHVVAARDARVWSVDKSPRGIEIVLDHGNPWATYYQHLETTTLAPHQSGFPGGDKSKPPTIVHAGDVIGTMGVDPLDAGKVRHLHFTPWYNGHGDSAAVDPGAQLMTRWARSTQVIR